MPSSLLGWDQYVRVKQTGALRYEVTASANSSGGRGGSLQYFTRDCLDPFPAYKVHYNPGDPWLLELVFPNAEVEVNFQKQLRRVAGYSAIS